MGAARLRLIAAVVSAIAITGCALSAGGNVATARRLAGEYLAALTGEAPDHGWSLILPDSRRAYSSMEEYVALAEQADWSEFSFRMVNVGDYCEDGGVYCVVRLQIDGATETIPAFLLEPPQSREDDFFTTFHMDTDEESVGNAELRVYFAPGGDRGILLGGG